MINNIINLIINADDLGSSTIVDSEIFSLMSQGFVTSATLMANGPTVETAAILSRQFPDKSFGVHLNLTSFRPLTKSTGLQVLLNSDGEFDNRVRSVAASPRLLYAVYKEFASQIERLSALGLSISHIDSHHHIHTIPMFFFVLQMIQKKYGIRKVRLMRNLFSTEAKVSKVNLIIRSIYNKALRFVNSAVTTDYFTNFATFIDYERKRYLRNVSIECMVHPGSDQKFYVDEIELLRKLFEYNFHFDFRLINYDMHN